MKKRKLIIKFEKSNITIKEGKNFSIGIPYRFDIQYGKSNIKDLFEILGFDVEIKESPDDIEMIPPYKGSVRDRDKYEG